MAIKKLTAQEAEQKGKKFLADIKDWLEGRHKERELLDLVVVWPFIDQSFADYALGTMRHLQESFPGPVQEILLAQTLWEFVVLHVQAEFADKHPQCVRTTHDRHGVLLTICATDDPLDESRLAELQGLAQRAWNIHNSHDRPTRIDGKPFNRDRLLLRYQWLVICCWREMVRLRILPSPISNALGI
ncbi:MAG: hypothetical protein HOE53_00960 [Candidatus Magasanikbacteria bacterium]|mgnify:CR=1 FL=1|nr:hypothetical protein [Candidatus Magasanikbacteria bacterium]